MITCITCLSSMLGLVGVCTLLPMLIISMCTCSIISLSAFLSLLVGIGSTFLGLVLLLGSFLSTSAPVGAAALAIIAGLATLLIDALSTLAVTLGIESVIGPIIGILGYIVSLGTLASSLSGVAGVTAYPPAILLLAILTLILCMLGPILLILSVVLIPIAALALMSTTACMTSIIAVFSYVAGPVFGCFFCPVFISLMPVLIMLEFLMFGLMFYLVPCSFALCMGIFSALLLEVCTIAIIVVVITELFMSMCAVIATLTASGGTGVWCTFAQLMVIWILTFVYAIIAIPLSLCPIPGWCLLIAITVIYCSGISCMLCTFPLTAIPFLFISICMACTFATVIVPLLLCCVGGTLSIVGILFVSCIGIGLYISLYIVGFAILVVIYGITVLITCMVSCVMLCVALPMWSIATMLVGFLFFVILAFLIPLWIMVWFVTFIIFIMFSTITGLPLTDWLRNGINTLLGREQQPQEPPQVEALPIQNAIGLAPVVSNMVIPLAIGSIIALIITFLRQ